jgi:uncharacterized protein YutE (UPF0331/DUF86 family)
MIDDVIINKSAIIRRCLVRIREEYGDEPERLDNFTIQDSIVLNLLRACESSIDLAMHLVAENKLGVPQSSRDSFAMLETAGLLTADTAAAMKRMCGFRNVAVHNYQEVEIPILQAILRTHLMDFERFMNELKKRDGSDKTVP